MKTQTSGAAIHHMTLDVVSSAAGQKRIVTVETSGESNCCLRSTHDLIKLVTDPVFRVTDLRCSVNPPASREKSLKHNRGFLPLNGASA